ncbi:MAG: 3D domain-containing protein [Deltaproteobacteria bacterium]|uniref:3D domain-containing protein n=1 Tax=Candidatus Zymogenus saltonus TaxID=2844893 RepID=A0A9D8KDS9_9DELT|nr:3D domain-containing protein [Candidatus Zymogenus saltonus]
MERKDILNLLAEELRTGGRKDREVAALFLKDVLIRRNESISNKIFAAKHLFVNWLEETLTNEILLIRKGYYSYVIKESIFRLKRSLFAYLRNIKDELFWDEAYSDLLIRNIVSVAAVVVLAVHVGSWKTVEDLKKPSHSYVTMDNKNWDDEVLSTILAAEEFDSVLSESLRENRIQELLESGHSYVRLIRVTGYYSPLPDQERYATGSYNGDIRLNGRGVAGADSTPVYLGMAAGPPSMGYGTKLIIRDLAKYDMPDIYTVHDRGSAIKGNRVDIWMGAGEEAMEKAYEITGYYKVTVVKEKR